MMTMMSKKAMLNVEFFTVLILFVGFSAYFSMRLIEIKPIYISEVERSVIRSESYSLGEVLMNDPGYPIDWETLVGTPQESGIMRVGMLDQMMNKSNLISFEKMQSLSDLCDSGSNYEAVKSLIGVSRDFSIIFVEKPSGVVLLQCEPSNLGNNVASIKRLAVFDSDDNGEYEYGELIIQVW